jgi:hypothetical protein
MTEHLHPNTLADLALAPVLIRIERNLARLREASDLQFALALELNDDAAFYHSPQERAGRLLRCAMRGVELHGWRVLPTADLHGLAVSHGEFSISLMFGKRLVDYVAGTPASAGASSAAGQPRPVSSTAARQQESTVRN